MVATAEMLAEISELKQKRKKNANNCENKLNDIKILLDDSGELSVDDELYDELISEAQKAKELVKIKE